MDQISNGSPGAPVQAPDSDGKVVLLPVSFSQQRLWLLDRLDPGSTSYIIPWSIRLSGRLHLDALARSLNEIVRRHEVLRTTFTAIRGEPFQQIADSLEIPVDVRDLRALPPAEREAEAAGIGWAEARMPVDIEKGPLVRATLIRLADDEHVLLLTLHHIVFDGWSRRIFARELAVLYEAFRNGKPSPLPDLRLQYADYAIWQRNHLKGTAHEKHLSYWSSQLANAPATLNLPTDYPRPAVQTRRGSALAAELPADLSQQVAALARGQGASLFMALLAAFQTLLSRYSGGSDILVGTPIANRTRAETEELIGLFANTLVLRGEMSDDPSFTDFLRRTKRVALDAYEHQSVPFEKIVEDLNPERSLSHNPLFQVMFSLQNAARQAFELEGIRLMPIEGTIETAKFDLSVFLSEYEGGIRGRIEYKTDLYERGTIERLWRHYEQLLRSAVENPDRRLSELTLLGADERELLLEGWNRTASDYPRELCVHQWFEQQAARVPRATAAVCRGRQISYGDLDERSNRLANYLRARGVGPETLVGLFVSRSLDMLVGLLGILKAGGAYVPIDPGYPKDRIAFVLDDAKLSLLVTERPISELLPPCRIPQVCLDLDWPEIARASAAPLSRITQPDNLAYVIFTSGSTGRPKGVQINHRNLVNFLWSMRQEPGLGTTGTLLAVTTICFDIAALELYLPLLTGARVVIASREETIDGKRLAELIASSQANVLQATPATWRMLLDAGWKGNPRLKALCGGEALPPELAARLLPLCGELWNMYGPTETTVWSSVFKVRQAPDSVTPIGRPIANTRFYILDSGLQPVPAGAVGELFIGGEGVARGYLNRPELTAEKFLPDPFQPEQRIYRTGDLARYLPGGDVAYLGRVDHQVKIRGYRIELGEIETALRGHPGVRDCVVTVREDVPGDRRLAAYVVPTTASKCESSALRAHLKKSLPDYLVPAFYVNLDSLPVTANGKLDRRALPKPEPKPADTNDRLHPRDDFELVVACIWKRVLDIQSCAMTDNFFEVGGHSLLLVRLAAMIEEEFGKAMPIAFLIESPTIEKIAAFLREGASDPSSFLVPFNEKGSGPALFLIHSVLGDVVGCRHLTRLLDPEQRVFGIQVPPEFRTAEFVSSVEGMARRYVEELLAFEPRGPYILGGWSAGAPLALEMAQQLRAAGHEVPLLIAIDSAPANTGAGISRANPLYYWKMLRNIPSCLKQDFLLEFSWRRPLPVLKRAVQRAKRRSANIVKGLLIPRLDTDRIARHRIKTFMGGGEYSESAKALMGALFLSLQRYVPKRYSGKVLLYMVRNEPLLYLRQVDRKWKSIAGDVEVVPVGGNHVTVMLGSHVKPLAQDLSRRLAEYRRIQSVDLGIAEIRSGLDAAV